MFEFFDVIIDWITEFFSSIGAMLIDLFITICNGLLDLIATLIEMLASIMPSLSIGPELVTQFPSPHNAICWLTWIFPVDVLFQCTQFYISLYLLKFGSGPLLRLFKIIK
jgi:hypothetical protein